MEPRSWVVSFLRWARMVPYHISTMRPRVRAGRTEPYYFSFGVKLFFDLAPGDDHYWFHFDRMGILIDAGPYFLFLGIEDTG